MRNYKSTKIMLDKRNRMRYSLITVQYHPPESSQQSEAGERGNKG